MGAQLVQGGGRPLPIALIGQAVPKLTRHELEALTERLIIALDELDGDLDVEPNGDERDGSAAEDDYGSSCNTGECAAAGCPIGDPDCAVDDQPCDEDYDQEHDYRTAPPMIYGDDQRRVMANTQVGVTEQYRHG